MTRRGRGRPPRDPVDELRARIWYWHVRERCNLSDYALSRRFASNGADGTAPKAFERIRREGVVPSDGSHRQRSFGLIARVDEDPEFRGTRESYDSPYWELARNPAMDLEDVRLVIARTLALLGLARPNTLMWRRMSDELPLPKPTRAYKDGIKRIVMRRHLNGLALLAALFRESLLLVELHYAVLLEKALQTASFRFAERLRALGNREHLSMFKESIDSDAEFLLSFATERLLRCSSEPDRTNLLESPRIPVIDRRLWERLDGAIYARVSIRVADE